MRIEFCPSCKKVLLPDIEKRRMRCSACGFERPMRETKLFTEGILKPKETLVVDGSRRAVRKACPQCGCGRAYAWGHGRSKENCPEPSNRFYRCARCGHRWKEM